MLDEYSCLEQDTHLPGSFHEEGRMRLMKKRIIIPITLILLATMFVLTSCGKSEFGCTENQEKKMVISAKEADIDSFFLTGTLSVADGEKLVISSDLEKGSVSLGFVSPSGMDDIETIPDVDVDPVMTAEVSGTQTQEYEIRPGDYLLKANVIEKATGTIQIDVK